MTQVQPNDAVDASADTRERYVGGRRRFDKWAMLILVIVVLAAWLPRARGPIDLRWDAGVYYILGTSIYDGKGYRLLNEPGNPLAIQYPPLFPAIIAAHQWVARALGADHPEQAARYLIKWTMTAATLAYVIGSYGVARWWLRPLPALGASLLVAANAWVTFLSDQCIPEIPFGLACVGFLAIQRSSKGWGTEVGAGVVGVACYLLRTLGLALLAAWVVDALIRKQFKRAAFRVVVAVVPVIAWQRYVSHVRHSPDYARPAYAYQRAPYLMYNVSYAENMALLDPFDPTKGPLTRGAFARRTRRNVAYVPAALGEAVSAQIGTWRTSLKKLDLLSTPHVYRAGKLAPQVLGVFALVGLGVLAWRREDMTVLFTGATVAMVCLTPWQDQFVRYLCPLEAVLAPAMVVGLVATYQAVNRPGWTWLRWGTSAVLLLAVVGVAVVVVVGGTRSLFAENSRVVERAGVDGPERSRLFYYNDHWARYDKALAWLKRSAKPDDVVVTIYPHWAYLNTGLKAVAPPNGEGTGETQQLIDTIPATYLIANPFDSTREDSSQTTVPPVIVAHPTKWQQVYDPPADGVLVYRRTGATRP
jgi:hypothetical protein